MTIDIRALTAQLPLHGQDFLIADAQEHMRMAARHERDELIRLRTQLDQRERELSNLEEIIKIGGYTPQQRALVAAVRRSFDAKYATLDETCAIDTWADDHAQLCVELGYTPKQAAEWLWDEGYYHPSQFEVSR